MASVKQTDHGALMVAAIERDAEGRHAVVVGRNIWTSLRKAVDGDGATAARADVSRSPRTYAIR
jgi:hypothetical protein